MKLPSCKLEFHTFSTSKLNTFANEVKNGIYANTAVFVTPTINEINYRTALADFVAAAADYMLLGITKRTAFDNKQEQLIRFLDSLANYVNLVAQGNVSIIALSGFSPSSSHTERSPILKKLEHFILKRTVVAGEIIVDILPLPNKGGVSYGCLCVEGAPLTRPLFENGQLKWSSGGPAVIQDANKSRRKVFRGLNPGVVYYFYVYASNSASLSH